MQGHAKSLNTTTAAAHACYRPRRFRALRDVVKKCLRGYSREAAAYSSGGQPSRFSHSPQAGHTLRPRVIEFKEASSSTRCPKSATGVFRQLLRLWFSRRKEDPRGMGHISMITLGQCAECPVTMSSTCGVAHTSGARRKASNPVVSPGNVSPDHSSRDRFQPATSHGQRSIQINGEQLVSGSQVDSQVVN
jgi:hypothetical protein